MPHFIDVVTAANLLRDCPLGGSLSRLATVDLSKRFGRITEEWLTTVKDNGGAAYVTDSLSLEETFSHKVTVYSCPSVIFKILTTNGIVHDSFQVAFQLSVDICFLFHEVLGEDDIDFDIFLATILDDCLLWIDKASLTRVIDLKIVESLVIFISSLYETYFSGIRLSIYIPPPDKCLDCLIALLQRMKQHMTVTGTTHVKSSVKPFDDSEMESIKFEKDIRACFSDIRASCIVTVKSIILACHGWVAASTERYWSLCTSSLSTPLLFSAGYRASLLQTTTFIAERHDIQHQLSCRIIIHLQNALQNVSRFSRSAADDIITAIRELAEHDCCELLPCSDYASDQSREISPSVGLLPALLLSYSSHPKLKATSRRFNESVSWKVAVTSAIEDIFKLAASSRKEGRGITDSELYTDAAPSFTDSFVQCSAGDLVVLYRVMDVGLDSSYADVSQKEKRMLALEHFGTSDGDALASLLSSLTVCLAAFLECDARVCSLTRREHPVTAPTNIVVVEDEDVDKSAYLTLSKLAKTLAFIGHRQAVFEDDCSQLIGEADLLNKIMEIV